MIIFSLVESGGGQAEKLIKRCANAKDREHAARKKNAAASHNSLLARAVLRKLLDSDAEVLIGENGKPCIENGPHISISHSKDMVACAVAKDFPIGIDIEYHRKRDFAKLAAYAFGPAENKQVMEQGAEAFYRIWTMREAIAKISGESIFSKMDGRDIDLSRWQVFEESLFGDYSFALAIENNGIILKDILRKVDITS